MSEVEQAILFYSRRNSKSIKLKRIIDSLGVIDIKTISVDSKKVKESLLQDKNYKIKEVPSVLVIYNNEEFIVLTGNELDYWFNQLIDNVRNLNQESQQEVSSVSEISETSNSMTPLTVSEISQTSAVKEIKKEGPSPAELAAQMSKQREQIEENLDSARPLSTNR